MQRTPADNTGGRLVVAAFVAILVAACSSQPPATEAPSLSAAPTPLSAAPSLVPATPAESTGPSSTPAPVAGGPPPVGDIPFYKVDAERSGAHPGPGPLVEPVVAWQVELGCAAGASTGVVGSGLLVAGCDAPLVTAIDVVTGAVRWTAETGGAVEGAAIDGDFAYVADSRGGLTALVLRSGDVRWHIQRDSGGDSPPSSPVVDGGIVYVGTHDGRFVGISAQDGSEKWSWTAPDGVRRIAGTVADGIAYVSGDDGYLRAISMSDRNELWRFRTLSGRISSPSITDQKVFVSGLLNDAGTGELYALDRATGSELWRYQNEVASQVAPPVNADGVVYAPSSPDGLVALDANDGGLLWRAPTAAVGGQAPAIAGDAIYQVTERGLAAYARNDGNQLWSIDLGASVENSALVTGGMVIVSDNSGLARAFVEPDLLGSFPSPTATSTFGPLSPAPSPHSMLTVSETFDAETSGLAIPAGIATGSDGSLYVVNTASSEILVLDPDTGEPVNRWGEHGSGKGQFNFIRVLNDPFSAAGGIAVSGDGSVYVAESANRRIQQFDSDGTFVRQWGRFGSDDGQFLSPIDVSVGPDGDVYVLDDARSDIQRFTSEGSFVSVIGEYGTGPGQLTSAGGITVGPDGMLYGADFESNRVQAWNADGSYAWMIMGDGSEAELFSPADVVTDDNGLLFVSDGSGEARARRISTYDQDRQLVGTWPAPGPSNTLAYSDGYVYVAFFFTSEILKLQIARE